MRKVRVAPGGSIGRRARCRQGTLRRNAFWAQLGFPNLVRARAAKARYRLERLQREELAIARSVNPYALPEDAHLWASVATGQFSPAPVRTTSEGSLVTQIKRARAAAAQAAQPVRKAPYKPKQ